MCIHIAWGQVQQEQFQPEWRSCVAAPLPCLQAPFWAATERGKSRFQLYQPSSVLLVMNASLEEIPEDQKCIVVSFQENAHGIILGKHESYLLFWKASKILIAQHLKSLLTVICYFRSIVISISYAPFKNLQIITSAVL